MEWPAPLTITSRSTSAKQSPYSGLNWRPANSTGAHRPTADTNLLWSHESDQDLQAIARASQDF